MSTSKHPKGLYLIFATSTAERFSYYGMRAIFILFLTQALLFDKEHAAPSTAATPDWSTSPRLSADILPTNTGASAGLSSGEPL